MASILIVEDEPIIGMLLAEVVEGLGHSVCVLVVSEDEAVAAAALHSPDLIIADAGLASGNGLSAIDRILETGFVPHVFTTGDALKVKRIRPNAIILEKPFHEADLATAIRLALLPNAALLA